MQYIKGKTSRKLMMEFKHIQKQYWGRHFWARGYFVASSGNVTDEAIAEYIRGQDGTEPSDGDDNFQVTQGDLYQSTSTHVVTSFIALVASGRATNWPDGIRTHWRSPTFTAY